MVIKLHRCRKMPATWWEGLLIEVYRGMLYGNPALEFGGLGVGPVNYFEFVVLFLGHACTKCLVISVYIRY